jgi:hypothetical protein
MEDKTNSEDESPIILLSAFLLMILSIHDSVWPAH